MAHTKRVVALQHIWDDPLGYLGELLRTHSIACDTIHVEAEPIPDPRQYDAVIILGGPQHANDDDRYSYFVQELACIRTAVEHDVPLLGICLGGQLLARALGGVVRRHSLTEIGFSDVQCTQEGKHDPLYEGLPGFQRVFQWHEDAFDLPPGAVQLATNIHTPNQAFRYGSRAYGLQYHIELDLHILDTWLHIPACKEDIIKAIGQEAYDALERNIPSQYPMYHTHTRIVFENFLRIGRLI